jgi:hypothetical protein
MSPLIDLIKIRLILSYVTKKNKKENRVKENRNHDSHYRHSFLFPFYQHYKKEKKRDRVSDTSLHAIHHSKSRLKKNIPSIRFY